ncbi:MAG TPA: hypothetical protein VMT37_16280 [Solirubrobacterales bacterium]|nr:hypothetical protein [Solirubrobacterales bacterium]
MKDAAPEDGEISPEEEAAVREARDELATGAPLVFQDEIKREFGIECWQPLASRLCAQGAA